MAVIASIDVIDTHTHSGHWWVKKENAGLNKPAKTSGDLVLRNFLPQDVFERVGKPLTTDSSLRYHSGASYVSNLDCIARENPHSGNFLKNEYDGNMELYNQYKNTSKAKLYAVCQPGYGNIENINRVFTETKNGFVGLKFHPVALNLPVDEKFYDEYMEFAKKYKLPCLFHSQVAIDWSNSAGKALDNVKDWNPSDPRLIYNLAKKYKDVPIILGHMGAGGEPAHKIAMDVLFESIDQKDAKLFAEISWMDFTPDGNPSDNPKNLIKLIEGLKKRNALDKILFGTDFPLGVYGETAQNSAEALSAYSETVVKLKNAVLKHFPKDGDDILVKIFNSNSNKLFDNIEPQIKKTKKSKAGLVVFTLAALITAGIVWIKKELIDSKLKKQFKKNSL